MSSDPIRLIDDPQVDVALRRHLEHATYAAPPSFDVDAELARLREALGPSGSGTSDPSTPAGSSSGVGSAASGATSGALGGFGALGGVVAVLLGGIGVTWLWMAEPRTPERAANGVNHAASTSSERSRPSVSSAASGAPASHPRSQTSPPMGVAFAVAPSAAAGSRALATRAASAGSSATVEGAASATPTAPSSSRARRTPAPAASAATTRSAEVRDQRSATGATTSAPDDRVRREIEHMARLRSALRRDPAAALALASAGQREFRGGLFGEEREAIAVLALARQGRTAEAERRGARFLRRYPGSAFAARIQRLVARP